MLSSAQSDASLSQDEKKLTIYNNDTLAKHLSKRFPEIKSKVNWSMTKFGLKATFEMGYEQHISLYDKTGKYIETLKKTAWGKSASPTLRMGFETGVYGLLPVLTFWEDISLDDDDYFFELLGTDGIAKEVWADADGNFFETPLFVK
jgi:hypothetical protein